MKIQNFFSALVLLLYFLRLSWIHTTQKIRPFCRTISHTLSLSLSLSHSRKRTNVGNVDGDSLVGGARRQSHARLSSLICPMPQSWLLLLLLLLLALPLLLLLLLFLCQPLLCCLNKRDGKRKREKERCMKVFDAYTERERVRNSRERKISIEIERKRGGGEWQS